MLHEVVHVQTRKERAVAQALPGFFPAVLECMALHGPASYYIVPDSQKSPQLSCVGGNPELMEKQHTENDVVAINIFMGGLLCKAEGKYYSSRINIFSEKSARRGGGFC